MLSIYLKAVQHRTRGVASLYAHTLLSTAKIWKIYIFHVPQIKAFLSLNRDD